MPEFMLLSNSFSPGRGALEHAMDTLAAFFADARQVLSSRTRPATPTATPRRCGRSSAGWACTYPALTGPQIRSRPWPGRMRCFLEVPGSRPPGSFLLACKRISGRMPERILAGWPAWSKVGRL